MTRTATNRAIAIAFAGLTAAALAGCYGEGDGLGRDSDAKSLTGKTFTGKKFYLGWGHAGGGDPMNMHNEVKYDVLHTHQIFTHELGGLYQGSKLIEGTGSTQAIVSAFDQIKSQVTSNDMYVQYSSGHGFQQGLQVGGSYQEIASRVLSLQAKEIIVFTMACHSGGLVDTFNSMRSQWDSFSQSGRTLFVMSSSTVQQTSSTGPGSDGLGGPSGSAGSAFGHALWKSLIGDSDGFVDGVKDGFVDLGEIEAYTKATTRRVGGHDPVATGVYNPMLVMNRVPQQKDNITYPERGTANWSDDQLRAEIQRTDAQWMNELMGGPR